MRVYDIRNAKGVLEGFELGNLFVPRRSVANLLRVTPGVTRLRVRRALDRSVAGDAAFCEFEFRGDPWVVLEPFGDNSRFLVVPDDGGSETHAEDLRAVFAMASPFRCWLR